MKDEYDFSQSGKNPYCLKLPKVLQHLLSEVERQRYAALYENDANGEGSLENVFKDILDTFYALDHSMCHPRLIWMAVLLSLATKPTVEAFLQHDSRPAFVIFFTLIQLKQSYTSAISSDDDNKSSKTRTQKIYLNEMIDLLFPRLSEGSQALDEGLDIFRNVLRTLNYSQSYSALLNILNGCFEGYAIFPGTSERRELFDWWLYEIIPVAWHLQLPRYFYTIRGLQTLEQL